MPDLVPVEVRFDWDHSERADVDGMTIYFFPGDAQTKLWRFDIAGMKGDVVHLPPGRYQVLTVNNDLSGVLFSMPRTYDAFTASAKISEGDTIASSTGMLYGASSPYVDIGFDHLAYDDYEGGRVHSHERILPLLPDSMCTVYHIEVDSIERPERIRTARAQLYRVARTANIATRRNGPETCAMQTSLFVDPATPGNVKGDGMAFGTPDLPDPKFYLKVAVTTQHATYQKNFDVTQQVTNYFNSRHVYIKVKGLSIPPTDPGPPAQGGVNLEVGVDGWQVVEITYS